MKYFLRGISACLLTLSADLSYAYPVDGYPETGIRRLEYYRLGDAGLIKGKKLYEGARLLTPAVMPRLLDTQQNAVKLPNVDRQLSAKLGKLIPSQPSRYSISLLDLSDPDKPLYAEHNPGFRDNVGSVGKMLVAVALFAKLRDIYPDDTAKRQAILKNTRVVADSFSLRDSHTVRFWNVEKRTLRRAPLRPGDSGNLYEYLDWMLSPSSNSAAAMVQRELVLMSHFGKRYPAPNSESAAYLKNTPKKQLGEVFLNAMNAPLIELGIDTSKLRQGSFFTRTGKQRIPGTSSYGTSRELMKLLYLMEAGQLVDQFSSIEIKRLMYLTERRIRYASHPNMYGDAIYFKSGSLYSCVKEAGFSCGKYKGNKRNLLASLAIVESPAKQRKYHYLVVVQSNVLRVNSAVAHQTLAARVAKLVAAQHPDKTP
ncbi:hypothetical protein AX279_02135 [Pseudomonas sp. J237]|nr:MULTISPECIES: hypothetical protein [Pseudomonas]OEO27104.1 hypothetical protein AX279_02135 [Pseudomonas sp. J237]